MSVDMAGKTALVTGASRGIGKATAVELAGRGANVVLSSRKQESLDEVAAEIGEACPDVGVFPYAAHVAHAEEAQACVAAAVERFGAVDILVNNAGTNPYMGPMVDIDTTRAEKTLQINELSILYWTQAVWRASMSERGGAIVNVASIGGLATELGIGFYNATKASVLHLTRQFAYELAPKVRVNSVAPGIVRTKLARTLWEGNEERINEALPLGRIGEPEDIAHAVSFLAGDGSSWMTGQSIVVDGGALVRPQVG